MPRCVFLFRRLLLPLLGALALGLAGCSDNERLSYAAELDEPNYREGTALLKSGRKQEALNAFLKVIEKRGDEAPESHLSVGLLYAEHINDPLSAIYHFRKYLALRPNGPQAPLVKQRIDAATRDFARTLPAQPLEGQLQRVDLVATLDRLKQENERLKQELADVKAGRLSAAAERSEETGASATNGSQPLGINFAVETIPTVRTRPLPAQPAKTPPLAPAPSRATSNPAPAPSSLTVQTQKAAPAATTRPVAGRKHTVQPGETLSKIAQQYYGNRAKWHDIYAANRGVMKNETDLKVGMELKIP